MALDEQKNTATKPDFELMPHKSLARESATLRIQWYIPPQTFLQIAAAGRSIDDAYVIVVVSYGKGQLERRYKFPAKQMEAVIGLERPGTAWIMGLIAWRTSYDFPNNLFWSGDHEGGYQENILRWDDTKGNRPFFSLRTLKRLAGKTGRYAAQKSVTRLEVDADYFAKPLPAWADWWLHFDRKERLANGCEILKAIPYALFVQPFWLTFRVLLKTLGLVLFGLLLMFLGTRGFLWKNLLHPFQYPFIETVKESWEADWDIASLLTKQADGSDRKFAWALWPLTPIFLFLLWIFSALVAPGAGEEVVREPLVTGPRIFLVLLGGFIIFSIPIAGTSLFLWLINQNNAYWDNRRKRKEDRRYSRLFEELTCPAEGGLRESSSFFGIRTMMLVNRAKTRMCRPTAR